MRQMDLEPKNYRERKPRGWRWQLPWSHDDDTKLPLVMFLLAIGALIYFYLNLPPGTSGGVIAGVTVFAACAGAMLMLWLRD